VKWLTLWWWRYLFRDCRDWENFWCRARGHPGPVWYTLYRDEPDMRCRRCGEDLG
jgi:hypothetical protein